MSNPPHPVSLLVARPVGARARLTTLFRPLLLLPHVLVVGVPIFVAGTLSNFGSSKTFGFGAAPFAYHHTTTVSDTESHTTTDSYNDCLPCAPERTHSVASRHSSTSGNEHKHGVNQEYGFGGPSFGALGAAACLIALLDWFAILFVGRALAGATFIKTAFLEWRARAFAYAALLRDEYPPFGQGAYPVSLVLPEPPPRRHRTTVLLRPLVVVPHLLALALLAIPALLAWVVGWLGVVFMGHLPASLWRYLRAWTEALLRVEAYLLLVHDEVPPFGIELGGGTE